VHVASVEGELRGPDKDRDARRRRHETAAEVRTGADGIFRLEKVNAGPAFRVTVTHPDYLEYRSPEPFPISAGGKVGGLVIFLKPAPRLTVTVVAGGSPVPNVHVEVGRQAEEGDMPPDAPPSKQSKAFSGPREDRAARVTSPEGKAVFGGLHPGIYGIRATASGYQNYRQDGIQVGDSAVEIPIALEPEKAITGSVVDSSGAPVPGARVRASLVPDGGGKKGWRNAEAESRATAASDGTFRLGGLADGQFVLHVAAEGFTNVTKAPVKPDDSPVTLKLERRGSISGAVITDAGEVVQAFSVYIRKSSKSSRQRDQASANPTGQDDDKGKTPVENSGGTFRIPNVDPGRYIVRIQAEGYSPKEAEVNVLEGAQAYARFVLNEGIVVSGVVTDLKTSAGVAGASIVVLEAPEKEQGLAPKKSQGIQRINGANDQDQAPPPSEFQMTKRPVVDPVDSDENGAFALRNIPPGKYLLIVNHPDYVIVSKPFDIQLDGMTRDLAVTLSSGEWLVGKVTGHDGVPLAGAIVTVKDSLGFAKKGNADADGRFEVHGLVPGPYNVIFSYQGQTELAQVTIKKGQTRLAHKMAEAGQ
jgi:protocatechuate 3,4-dioxygenase beta subunit